MLIGFYKRYNLTPKVLKTDFERNLGTHEVEQYLIEQKMEHENSGPYRHHQNLVERNMQTVTKGTSAFLHGQTWLRADK